MSRLIRYANSNDAEALGKIHSQSSQEGYKGIIPDDVLYDVFLWKEEQAALSVNCP